MKTLRERLQEGRKSVRTELNFGLGVGVGIGYHMNGRSIEDCVGVAATAIIVASAYDFFVKPLLKYSGDALMRGHRELYENRDLGKKRRSGVKPTGDPPYDRFPS